MAKRRPFFETVKLIDVYVQEWLHKENIKEAKPRELMPYLIEKGVFACDHREGLPLRKVLRQLKKDGKLKMIRGVSGELKGKNHYWLFRQTPFVDC